ncbi:uncharacterized protein [Miscanthus floridulus]|uniref:uncharacterized protein n=1 Tax=Miscanthus floridulus TaxID=154761 RepID=UPI003459189E
MEYQGFNPVGPHTPHRQLTAPAPPPPRPPAPAPPEEEEERRRGGRRRKEEEEEEEGRRRKRRRKKKSSIEAAPARTSGPAQRAAVHELPRRPPRCQGGRVLPPGVKERRRPPRGEAPVVRFGARGPPRGEAPTSRCRGPPSAPKVGKAFIAATFLVFGGATAVMLYTADKLQLHSEEQ